MFLNFLPSPKNYYLSDLVDYIMAVLRREDGYKRKNLKWDVPMRLRITLTEKICPSWPVAFLGWDKIERVGPKYTFAFQIS